MTRYGKVYDEPSDEQFMDNMGDYYNDPEKLVTSMKHCISEGITCYLIISKRKHGTWAFGGDYINDIVKLLENSHDGSSWQIIMDNICTPMRNEHKQLVKQGLAEPIAGEDYKKTWCTSVTVKYEPVKVSTGVKKIFLQRTATYSQT